MNATTPPPSSPSLTPSAAPSPRRFFLCGARKTNGEIVTASPYASPTGVELAMASPPGDDTKALSASSSPQDEANKVAASVTASETADMIADTGDLAEASATAVGPVA